LGGLAHKPWRIDAAEGRTDAGVVADVVLAGARPTAHNSYKLLLTRRAIAAALSDARNTEDAR
jgi:xanthine dehydrogenase YagS FAD-binding subunit